MLLLAPIYLQVKIKTVSGFLISDVTTHSLKSIALIFEAMSASLSPTSTYTLYDSLTPLSNNKVILPDLVTEPPFIIDNLRTVGSGSKNSCVSSSKGTSYRLPEYAER